jgi:hypothetical protein
MRQEKLFNGALLVFTIVLVFLPLSLKSKTVNGSQATIPMTANFRVAIPYSDESLEKNMGVARWGRRLLCEAGEVQAASESEAIVQMLKSFEDSRRDIQMISSKDTATNKVSVIKDRITVQKIK